MFNLLLGVADSKAVTKEDLLEFENSIYGQMKDVQEVARNVQADQISFLTNNFTIFLTILGLILAAVAIVATLVFNRIKKNSDAAKEEMNRAAIMMEKATGMMEKSEKKSEELDGKLKEVDQKLEYLNKAQVDLKDLLDSKELEEKITHLEKAAASTSSLEKNVRAHFSLLNSERVIQRAIAVYEDNRRHYNMNPKLVQDANAAINQCNLFLTEVAILLEQHYIVQDHPTLVFDLQHYEKVENMIKKANIAEKEANEFYQSYIRIAVNQENARLQKELLQFQEAYKMQQSQQNETKAEG